MARGVGATVLVVATLIAFFATFFAVMELLGPEGEDRPRQTELASATPAVSAPPREAEDASPPPAGVGERLKTVLEELGVKCAEGASCYPE